MVNCPIQVKATCLVLSAVNKIRLVVNIAIAKKLHDKLAGFTVLVHILRQQRASKSQGTCTCQPCGEIFLVMICIAYHNTLTSLIVSPCDRFLLACVFVGNPVVVHHLADTVYVGTAAKLVPFIIGKTVSVGILTDHDNSRLRTACICQAGTCKCITHNIQVILACNVNYWVIKAKSYIATKATKANHTLIGKQFGTLCCHSPCIVTIFPLGHGVDKLSWGRHIFINLVQVG